MLKYQFNLGAQNIYALLFVIDGSVGTAEDDKRTPSSDYLTLMNELKHYNNQNVCKLNGINLMKNICQRLKPLGKLIPHVTCAELHFEEKVLYRLCYGNFIYINAMPVEAEACGEESQGRGPKYHSKGLPREEYFLRIQSALQIYRMAFRRVWNFLGQGFLNYG